MSNPTNFQLIKLFHDKFDPSAEKYDDLLARRLSFLTEEFREVTEAVAEVKAASPEQLKEARAHLVKELCDVLGVTYGFLHLMGVDADAAFAEVNRSNMSKTPNHGGKAIKGESYTPAQMERFVK